jgi:glycosyltransferase involved in cell wall biosynthesis
MKKPKVALVTEWLVQYGGSEKTLEAIAELFPDAPIYAAKYVPDDLSDFLNSRKIISPKSSIVNKITKYFFAFVMAPIFEEFDLREYDIIISNGTTWPKGVIAQPHQLHISYIHTPPRFLYGYSTESTKRDKWYFKVPFSYVDNIFRLWDYIAAQRPDFLLTNSSETQSRINKFYRRDATIMYPPTDVKFKETDLTNETKEKYGIKTPYFLVLGRLAAYKNFDAVIEVFNRCGTPLAVVGTGYSENKLRKMAKENVIFTGRVSEKEKHEILSGSLGLINSVDDEDFGIVPIEAQAHGKPVLAFKSGGHLETVEEGVTGMFFEKLDPENLLEKVKEFEQAINNGKFNPETLKNGVQHFSKERFQQEFENFVAEKWRQYNK